jgi:cell division transport system permease protein
MKIRTLGRHIREGVKNVGRNGWMTVASIVSLSVTLLILGSFLILAFNLNHITTNVESGMELRVFLRLDATEQDVRNVEQAIQKMPQVEETTFVPGDEALDRLIASLGEDGAHFEDFKDEQVLPHVFVVRTAVPQDLYQVAEEIRKLPAVDKVNDGGETTRTLFQVTGMIRNAGLVFIVGLAFTALLLIINTIRMTISMRKQEIEIMKLVGATNAFVRWPFFVEGVLLGLIGACIPILILSFGYNRLLQYVMEKLQLPFFDLLPITPLMLQISLILLGIGALIGFWGSLISMRRFLKV